MPHYDRPPKQTSPVPPELDRGRQTAAYDTLRSPLFSINTLVAGRFLIRRFLGEGGLGQVFEAEDQLLRQRVALKTLQPGLARGPDSLGVLSQEVTLARRVTHPNVCRIYELLEHRASEEESGPQRLLFLTMELIDGETLREYLQRQDTLPPAKALELASQVASGLDAVHQAGVVHGDLTAANVLLDTGGGKTKALLADFGLASLASSPRVAAGGTRAYMAPERRDGGVVTPAADIYAFGVLLQEILGTDRGEAGALRMVSQSPKMQSCLAEAPEDRPTSASGVIEELRGSLGRSRRRRDSIVGLALLAVLSLGALFIYRGFAAGVFPNPGRPSLTAALVPQGAARPSVLVPDFQDLSTGGDSEWLAPALAELVTSHLAVGESIVTYPRRYLAQKTREPTDALQAAALARWLIDGAYVLDGERVQVRIKLVDTQKAETHTELNEWGSVDALFDLVDRLNIKLRAALGAPQSTPVDRVSIRRSLPRTLAAFKAYSSGLELLRESEYPKAREALLEALEHEPAFALTHSALAEALDALGYSQEAQAQAQAAEALGLSGELSRQERLQVQMLHARLVKDWPRAEEVARALWVVFPEQPEYGLELAKIQNQAGNHRQALETLGELRDAGGSGSSDPRLDLETARAHLDLAEYAEALSFALSAEQAAQAVDQRQWVASSQVLQAEIQLLIGDLGAADESVRRAVSSVAQLKNPQTQAELWLLVGDIHQNAGNLSDATTFFQRAIDFYRTTENRSSLATALARLANVVGSRGDQESAVELLEQSLAIVRELGDLDNVSAVLGMLATRATGLCDLDRSHSLYSEALEIARKLDSPQRLAETLNNLSELDLALGRISQASLHLTEAHRLAVSMGNRMGEAITLLNLALLDLNDLRLAQASAKLTEAIDIAGELDVSFLRAHALLLQGELARIRAQPELARSRTESAIALFGEIGNRGQSAVAQHALARIELESGRLPEAARLGEYAHQVFRDIDWRPKELAAAATLSSIAVAMGNLEQARQILQEADARRPACRDREAELALLRAEASLLAAEGSSAVSSLEPWFDFSSESRPSRRDQLEMRLLWERLRPRKPMALEGLANEAREAGHLAVAQRAAALAEEAPSETK